MERSADLDKAAEEIIGEYPVKRSAAMMLMHLIQERFGYFDDEAIAYVAEKLEMEPIAVYGMLSFYPMFTESPKGRVHIKVCRTLSCALVGSLNLADEISRLLDCPIGESKGIYTLEFVECVGNCSRGANVHVNDRLYDMLKPAEAGKFVDMIKEQVQNGGLDPKPASAMPQGADFDDPAFKG